jgi:hypothetical protein
VQAWSRWKGHVIHRQAAAELGLRSWSGQRSTSHGAILKSGLLASVSNPELRDRLAALPRRCADGGDDDRDALEYTLAIVRPLLERPLLAHDFTAVLGQMRHWLHETLH